MTPYSLDLHSHLILVFLSGGGKRLKVHLLGKFAVGVSEKHLAVKCLTYFVAVSPCKDLQHQPPCRDHFAAWSIFVHKSPAIPCQVGRKVAEERLPCFSKIKAFRISK